MSLPLTNQKYRRPLVTFADVLRKEAAGQYVERGEYVPFMFRAYVYAVDTVGAMLENDQGETGPDLEQTVTDSQGTRSFNVKAALGPPNPPDSVKARIITNNMDQFLDDDDLRVYWPMFPGLQNPSPGELVYVVFEDSSMTHGLWVSKVPFDNRYDNPNLILQREVSELSVSDSIASSYPDDEPGDAADTGANLPANQNPMADLF